jgi:hypothetical protein
VTDMENLVKPLSADVDIRLWMILLREKRCGAFNVGSGDSHAILDVARTLDFHGSQP